MQLQHQLRHSVAVNNQDGTSTLPTTATGTLLWSTGATTASITVQTAATYTVTNNHASGCTSLQGSGVAAPKQLLLLQKCCKTTVMELRTSK
jgi:hypothetical protein